MLKQLKKQAGTSLINLIATIGIIGTTTAMSAGQVDEILAQARNARRQLDIRQIQIALELYYSDFNQYPLSNTAAPTVAGWQNLATILTTATQSAGPWISEVTPDPLNRDGFVYQYGSAGQTYEIWYYLETDGAKEKKVLKNL